MNASTKIQLQEIEAYLNRNLMAAAMDSASKLLATIPLEELKLARPDVEPLIDRFLHKQTRASTTAGRTSGRGNDPAAACTVNA